MNKKLMLLVVGALTALAFTALPGAASAKETSLKCEGEAGTKCLFTIDGGESRFSLAGGDTVWCSSVDGNGEVTGLNAERESTTSSVQLLFHLCKETATPFHFACSNTATSGTVTTNVMTGHNIALTSGTQAGVLLTDSTVTFTCAGGFASTQVTGNIIGEYENECNTNTGTVQKINFGTPEETPHGNERLKTYTGVTYDLEGKTAHTGGGSYETAAQTGTGTLTFNQNVILTCA